MKAKLLWLFLASIALLSLAAVAALADSSYQVQEQPPPTSGNQNTDDQGPIRLARFSYVQGNITWRPSASVDWSAASVNLPIRQGAQIWVTDGGRAEIQFDDGSYYRLGNGTVATLQTLDSDSDGEFTEIQMNEGLSTLNVKHAHSVYQIDTPFVSIKTEGPSKVRIGVDNSVEVAVHSGTASVSGGSGETTLDKGSYLELDNDNSPYDVGSIPARDSWDQWNFQRDRELTDAASAPCLPSNIALVSGNLSSYGDWREDATYGWVWHPNNIEAGWRPYYHGHWVWVEPFGWTWVAEEPWGWAPYHYGTWISLDAGWCWVPGPATQYWCPAVVHFSEYNGDVCWAPLAPREVRYPSVLSVGFRSGDWSLFFSIGGAAVYYPHDDSYCEARPFDNGRVNRNASITNVTNIYNNTTTINVHNVYMTDNHFVPYNARNGAGVTSASPEAFGGRGTFQEEAAGNTDMFVNGRGIGAPAGNGRPVNGPISVHPTAGALTPGRSFLPSSQPASRVLSRPIFHAPVAPAPGSTGPQQPSNTNHPFNGGSVGSQRPPSNGHTFNGGLQRPTQAPDNSATTIKGPNGYHYGEASALDKKPMTTKPHHWSNTDKGNTPDNSSKSDKGGK